MCGITGIWRLDTQPIASGAIEAFTDALAHRGPDGRGIFRDRGTELALGHRRLAILDLGNGGRQPMSYADGRYQITYNGEIYNFLELRHELEQYGHRFRTDSDTEVILASYAEWGADCQRRFNGMWAFGIWDSRERRLFLSRDRYGVKPLFYRHEGGIFSFASELKAFLKLDPKPPPDLEAFLLDLRAPGTLEPSARTLLAGVARLGPGHSLVVTPEGPTGPFRWWNPVEELDEPCQREDENVEKFRELFLDACRIRGRSDVPIASALSGGLDSGAIVCALSHLIAQGRLGPRSAPDLRTVIIASHQGSRRDETPEALETARFAGARILIENVSADAIGRDVESMIHGLEEIYDATIGPWLIYQRLRREKIPISLDGHGGDELLGGYHKYADFMVRSARDPRESRALRRMRAQMGSTSVDQTAASRFLYGVVDPLYGVIMKGTERFPSIRRAVRTGYEISVGPAGDPLSCLADRPSHRAVTEDFVVDGAPGMSPLNQMLFRDFHHTVLPVILRNFDRCSMAHGVEVRAPFLDYRLVRFAFSLPDSHKIDGRFTKSILRKALIGIAPDSLRVRTRKQGFVDPLGGWFRSALREWALDHASSVEFGSCDLWNGARARSVVEAAVNFGDDRYARPAFRLLQAHVLMDGFRSGIEPKTPSRDPVPIAS